MEERASVRPQRVEIGEPVVHVAMSPAGWIYAATAHGQLACIDPAGRRAWERRWAITESQPFTLRVADDGRPWVGLDGGLIEIDHDGRDRRSLDLTRDERERLGSFLLAPDGFYACLCRRGLPGGMNPRITRLDPSGSPLWSTTLPVGRINYSGVVEIGDRTGWQPQPMAPWRPRTWEPIRYGGSEPLLLAGDRLLASFFEFPRSGIGCSYGLDAGSGALVWVTEPVPTHTLAIAGPGRFYQGLQGYGAFETRLLGPDGSVLRRWESHGYLVIAEEGEVRCVEMENVLPSKMHYSVLRADGSVGEGPHLEGYYTTYPAISREGVVAFWRSGELVLIGDEMRKEVIYSEPTLAEPVVLSRMLLSPDGSLVFAVGHEVWIVGAGLRPLAESTWPCGGGNLRNNPVRV